MPLMLSTTPISGRTRCPCAKKTFHILPTRTNWIGETRAARDKRFLQRHKAARLAEVQMANGQAKARHHSHGRMATEDMAARKTEVHPVWTAEVAATTGVHTNTDRLRLHHQASDGQTGAAAAEEEDTMGSLLHPQTADTLSHLFHAMALTVPTAAEDQSLQATPTSPVTELKGPAAPGNQTTVRAEAPATLEIHVKATLMTAPIATATTTEILLKRDETGAHGREVPNGETIEAGTQAGRETQLIFIGEDSHVSHSCGNR